MNCDDLTQKETNESVWILLGNAIKSRRCHTVLIGIVNDVPVSIDIGAKLKINEGHFYWIKHGETLGYYM